MAKINEEIFRTYDIRGTYPDEISADSSYAVARATVRFLKAKKLVVGRDMRIGSPALLKAAIKGVIDEGADVFDVGMVGIELIYFACGSLSLDGGLMMTASHNPKEYSGIKLVRENAISLTTGTGLSEVKKIALKEPWLREKEEKKRGRVYKKDVLGNYISYIKKIIDPKNFKPLKVVVDAENGMSGKIIEQILKESKIKLFKLNFKPDGNFPKHEPNPLLAENREEAKRKLESEKADVSFVFDGDGDRVTVLDEKGEFLMTDFVGAIVAEKLLNERGPGSVVWDLRRGWAIKDVAKKNKSKFYHTKAGFPFIKLRMREKKSIFGGETSSHYFFRDFFTSDSGILIILHIIDLLSKTEKPLSRLLKKFRENYFMVEEINYETKNAERIFLELKKYFGKQGGKISHLDGISVDFPEWHFNIRASNTEPFIRLNIEARSEQVLKEKTKEVEKIVNKFK